MKLNSTTIPQADLIWDVARVTDAIHAGATTPQAIGEYIGEKGPRQRLYYAQAARVLGLVAEDILRGQLTLTARGQAFVQYDRTSRRRALRHIVLQREPTRSIINALIGNDDGLTIEGLTRVVQALAQLSPSTAQRRARTVAAWLRDLGLASWKDGRLVYHRSTMPSAPI